MSDQLRTAPLVLLVDSDKDSAKSFRKHFGQVALHWEQIQVKDGREAVHHMLFHGFPDLVVTRCESANLNALDLVEWVRSMKSPRPISFIIWDKIVPRKMEKELDGKCGLDYLHPGMPEDRLRKALMQVVAKSELSLASPTPKPI